MVNLVAALFLGSMKWDAIYFLLVVAAVCFLLYMVYIEITLRMARNRHREPLPWVLLSLLVSPLLTWIILLIVGDKDD